MKSIGFILSIGNICLGFGVVEGKRRNEKLSLTRRNTRPNFKSLVEFSFPFPYSLLVLKDCQVEERYRGVPRLGGIQEA